MCEPRFSHLTEKSQYLNETFRDDINEFCSLLAENCCHKIIKIIGMSARTFKRLRKINQRAYKYRVQRSPRVMKLHLTLQYRRKLRRKTATLPHFYSFPFPFFLSLLLLLHLLFSLFSFFSIQAAMCI